MKGNKFFVNEFDVSEDVKRLLDERNDVRIVETSSGIEDVILLKGVLTELELSSLVEDLDNNDWIPVGINGMKSDYKEGDLIGSYRLSCYEPELAEELFDRVRSFVPNVLNLDEYAMTEWGGHADWELIGINPLFRFIRYTEEGLLVTHYDRSFVESEDVRSLLTLVLYVESAGDGGETRFVVDVQKNLPLDKRDLSDWDRNAYIDELEGSVKGDAGDVIVFNHLHLHDSTPIVDGRKTIMRTDFMYKKI